MNIPIDNSRRANFEIMRRTFRTLNDCEMQHNEEVGLFTKLSTLYLIFFSIYGSLKKGDDIIALVCHTDFIGSQFWI
jgi:hypothetical protein